MSSSCHPKLPGPNWPKSKWRLNTKTESRPKMFGPNIAESQIGFSGQNGKRKKWPTMSQMPRKKWSLTTNVILALSFVILAFTGITIGSHNLHGFTTSSNYHKQCIENHQGIWFCQEHWLSEQNLNKMSELGVNYVARSGMEDRIASGIYSGRPFGGVGISWSPKLDHLVNPLTDYRHKRVVAVEVRNETEQLILISVYMPFFNHSKKEECMLETIDAITMIESIIDDHPLHKFVIGGDYNTELNGNSQFDSLWHELMAKYNLSNCDDIISVNSLRFTYNL